jgi:hypothetical protein
VIRRAERREHRHREQHHHPARVHSRLEQLRTVQLEPIHRRAHEQVEIAREKEAGQRGDDVRQQQDREESDQDHPEELAGEERPEVGHAAKINEQLHEQGVDEHPEQRADEREEEEARAAPTLVRHGARARREQLRPQKQRDGWIGTTRCLGQHVLRHSGPRPARARRSRR